MRLWLKFQTFFYLTTRPQKAHFVKIGEVRNAHRMNQNQRYEARVAFRINGIHALGHEPGACTLQNLAIKTN